MNASRTRNMEVVLELVVPFDAGPHLRHAAEIAGICSQAATKILFAFQGRSADGRSVMELVSLGAARGAPIEVRGRGGECVPALDRLRQLFSASPA